MGNRVKVLVAGHDLKFWQTLQLELKKTGAFEFRQDVWTGHNSHDPAQSEALLDWAEVIVAEWTLGNAVYYSHNKRPHQRLLTRFHLQERETPFPAKLKMQAVDKILFVGQHILDEAVSKFSLPADKVEVVGNFVDVDLYRRKKFSDSDLYIGMIGTAPRRKRLDLAVDLLEALLVLDPRYRLHVKGTSPRDIDWLWHRTLEREYYTAVYRRINSSDALRHKVIFDPQGGDVAQWLTKIGYIISPSDFESFHMAVAEGSSSGAVPVVWPWEGSDSLYPFAVKMSDPVAVAKNIDMLRRSRSREALLKQSHDHVKEHFGRDKIRDRWRELLLGSGAAASRSSLAPTQAIIVWGIDSWETFHRREMLEALASNLAGHAVLLYIEPSTHVRSILQNRPDQAERLAQEAILKPRNPYPGVYVTRVLTGGFPAGMARDPILTTEIPRGAKAETIARRLWGDRLAITHWIYKPNQTNLLPENSNYIYEVYDDYTISFGSGERKPEVAAQEAKAVAGARHVFFTSEVLKERKSQGARASTLVPNGVDFAAFRRWVVPRSADAPGRPVVGYLGNLSDFFDWEIMGEVCSQMPDVDFVFHGQVERHALKDRLDSVERLMGLPNTLFTGRVSRPVGAAAVARYDALTIPFVVNDAMHAVNPLKLWEYFAVGAPVVSSPMDTVRLPSPLLRVAHGVSEWVEALRAALDERDPRLCEERVTLARANDWKVLTRAHASVLLTN